MRTRTTPRHRAGLRWTGAALLALGGGAAALGTDEDRVELARAALQEWVQTRRLISDEEEAWNDGKQVLQDRIDGLRRELESVDAAIAAAEEEIEKAESGGADFEAQKAVLEEGIQVLDDSVVELEKRTKVLVARLPRPVKNLTEQLISRLPDDPEDTQARITGRYEAVIGLLNECNKYNRRVETDGEVLNLGGTEIEVDVFYVGLGGAYYVSPDGKYGGVGRPTADGWEWVPVNDAAEAIQQAYGMLEKGDRAEVLALPVQLSNGGSQQ